MCNSWDLEVVAHALSERDVQAKRVLEVGSLDVNGSIRPGIQRLGPAEYVGLDMRQGPGVDVVCAAAEIDPRFGPDAFDVVIFKYVVRPGGLFIKARKPVHFVEGDLSDHRLYSILRQRKGREATDLDIVCFEIRYRFLRVLMDLLPKRYRRAVHERFLR